MCFRHLVPARNMSGFWRNLRLMKGKSFYWDTHGTLWKDKKERKASFARMGRVHVYAIMFFLEWSHDLSPSACALPQTLCKIYLLLWPVRALQFACEASHTILIIYCIASCRYEGKKGKKGEKSRAWSEKGGKWLCMDKTFFFGIRVWICAFLDAEQKTN